MSAKCAILRRWVGLVVLASLLFARLAVAGYVCPMEAFSGSAEQSKISRVDCLNSDSDQPALCAESFSDGRSWADSNGHPPGGDAPPIGILLQPLPFSIEIWVPLQRLTFSAKVSESVYLKTARLRL